MNIISIAVPPSEYLFILYVWEHYANEPNVFYFGEYLIWIDIPKCTWILLILSAPWLLGFEWYRYWGIGYWPILAGIGWYWYRPNTFFTNRSPILGKQQSTAPFFLSFSKSDWLIIIKLIKASYSWNCTNLCIYRYNKWRHFWYRYCVLVPLDAKVLGIGCSAWYRSKPIDCDNFWRWCGRCGCPAVADHINKDATH